MALEPVQGRERRLVDLVDLAEDGVIAASDQPGEWPEVMERERGLGPRLRDAPSTLEEVMVPLAGQQRAVDEHAGALLDLSRAAL
jgi:hypothetical protein